MHRWFRFTWRVKGAMRFLWTPCRSPSRSETPSPSRCPCRDPCLKIYKFARDYARQRGIIIADTKFEFGLFEGKLILIDEVLTPDSSRFWPASEYAPGKGQPSFDKQFVRDYLETLDWDKNPPAPALPPEVIAKSQAKYLEAYEKLTGKTL